PVGVPASRRVPPPALSPRGGWCVRPRPAARSVLPGLLLGADVGHVRRGGGEPVVDGRPRRPHVLREGWTARGCGGSVRRRSPAVAGRRGPAPPGMAPAAV